MSQNPEIQTVSRTPETSNRAYDVRRDTDSFTTPAITIHDIDYAVLHHLNNNIQFTVTENGQSIRVPVVPANGERWAQIQRSGYLRDAESKLITPIITLKRTNIGQDDRYNGSSIPGSNRGNSLFYYPATQHNNQHDWINQLDNTKESTEYYVVPIPDFILVSYDLYIWTTLTMQMNEIVQAIIPQHRLPWGDVFKFVTNLVGEYPFETLLDSGEDRLVRCVITLQVDGMLLNEFTEREATVQKAFTTKRVTFMNEREEYEIYPEMPKEIHSQRRKVPKNGFE